MKKSDSAFPMRSLVVGVGLTIGLTVAVASAYWQLDRLSRFVSTQVELRTLTGRILYLDEVLTMSARMGAHTGDPRWEERYRRYEPELTAAFERWMALAIGTELGTAMESANSANDALVRMEEESFQLVHAGRGTAADSVLNSDAYEVQKGVYRSGLRQCNAVLAGQAEELLRRQRRGLVLAEAMAAIVLGVLSIVWLRLVSLIRSYVQATQTAEKALEEYNATLGERVFERTQELSSALERLRHEMDLRARAETDLRQAQKLEAVGRLASGIAHEINTPIQFVGDSLHFLRESSVSGFTLLREYQQLRAALAAGAVPPEMLADLARAEEEADLDYLAESVPKAFERCADGLDRVASIVRSMKEFAHPDQKEKVVADLNHALTTTLTIARNEYKYVADVETDLGPVPPVRCYLNEMNQVFLNIIVNAAQAIGDVVAGTDIKGRIGISTRVEADAVVVRISDTGPGIPAEIQEKIFDPFFTTKEVGKGTGQGLAIARSVVVDKHGGSIDFDTQMGMGTTFVIRLPLDSAETTAPVERRLPERVA